MSGQPDNLPHACALGVYYLANPLIQMMRELSTRKFISVEQA